MRLRGSEFTEPLPRSGLHNPVVPLLVRLPNSALTRHIIYSVRTSQETHYVSATKPNRLMLFRERVAVYCENHTKHTDTLCGRNAEL
jgi:hypothetical protein